MTDADRDEIAEVVRQAVLEVLDGDDRPRRALPVHHAMTAEWRLLVTLSTGVEVPFDADTEAEALELAGRFTHSRWHIEHRLVSAWAPVPPPPGHEGRD